MYFLKFGIFRIILLLSICVWFVSCDPGYGVIIVNESNTELNVKVIIGDTSKHLNFRNDSVGISEIGASDALLDEYSIKAHRNMNDGSYNFLLPGKKRAAIQGGIGTMDRSQKIYINGEEIYSRWNQKNLQKKGTFMSKLFVITYK